jgi:hypothetical protein
MLRRVKDIAEIRKLPDAERPGRRQMGLDPRRSGSPAVSDGLARELEHRLAAYHEHGLTTNID